MKAIWLKTLNNKIARYLVAGGTGFLVNITIFSFLIWLWPAAYVLSSGLAYLLALAASFWLQKWWTFRDHRRDVLSAQVLFYALSYGLSIIINMMLVYLFVAKLSLGRLPAQALGSLLIAIFSYFIYNSLIFRGSLGES